MTMKPICPQLPDTVYDETAEEVVAQPSETKEDCLYLNIWVPEVSTTTMPSHISYTVDNYSQKLKAETIVFSFNGTKS